MNSSFRGAMRLHGFIAVHLFSGTIFRRPMRSITLSAGVLVAPLLSGHAQLRPASTPLLLKTSASDQNTTAQSTVTLAGTITDASLTKLAGATVKILSSDKLSFQVDTSESGAFSIAGVPLGKAKISVTVRGVEVLARVIDVRPSLALNLTLTNNASSGLSMSEHIQVTATLDKAQTEVTTQAGGLPTLSTVIRTEQIEHSNVGRDVGDILNRVPGVAIATLPQGDIGNGIKLRGFFTRSHGADVSVYIDGAPQNLPASTIGGTGFNDMSWLLPELIDRVEVIKGPFSALYGDQNRAGAINIVTRDAAESRASMTYGRFGFVNTSAIFSRRTGPVQSLVAANFMRSGGYRQASDFLHGTFFAKETLHAGNSVWGLRGFYQGSNWNAPGFLLLSALQAGTVVATDRDTSSPKLFGDANRTNFTLTRRPNEGETGLFLTAYAERYNRRRATGANATTVNVQSDARWISGGRAVHTSFWRDRFGLTVGGEVRSDYGTGITRQQTSTGFTDTYLQDQNLNLLQYGSFAQGQAKLLPTLKLSGGLRIDGFHYDITNLKIPAASATYNKPVVTPKIGIAWSPKEQVSVFFNMGQGFRSVDQSEISPSGSAGPLGATGGNSITGNPPPKVTSYDYGFKAQLGSRWSTSAAGFYTLNQSEIVQVGAYTFSPAGDSTRLGWEAEAKFQATNALSFYANLTDIVKARLNNPANGISNQLNVPQYIPKAGIAYLHNVRRGSIALNLDGFYYSGFPYYTGTPLTLRYTKPFARYDVRGSYYVGHVELTGFAQLQPYRFSSEAMFSSATGLSLDPAPHWNAGITGRYRF